MAAIDLRPGGRGPGVIVPIVNCSACGLGVDGFQACAYEGEDGELVTARFCARCGPEFSRRHGELMRRLLKEMRGDG